MGMRLPCEPDVSFAAQLCTGRRTATAAAALPGAMCGMWRRLEHSLPIPSGSTLDKPTRRTGAQPCHVRENRQQQCHRAAGAGRDSDAILSC
eukprot:7067501-Prymnesium_polylepis.1